MVGPRFFIRAFAAGALLVFAVCARADALRADFSPLTLRPRSNAPALFDLKLHRAGAGLLEGALEITFEAGGEVVLRQRTQDLTLAAGTQSFRIVAPPLPHHESYSGTEARLRFVAKTAAVDLGRFPIEAASRGTRNFVIAVCDSHAAGARDVALWQSLRLESFFPAGTNADRLIATSPAFLAPEDFPANPLALCARWWPGWMWCGSRTRCGGRSATCRISSASMTTSRRAITCIFSQIGRASCRERV